MKCKNVNINVLFGDIETSFFKNADIYAVCGISKIHDRFIFGSYDMDKWIISIVVYSVLIYCALKILVGEQIKKIFTVHSEEVIEAKVIQFKSKDEMYKENLGRTMNEYWSIVEYEYLGKWYQKKIQRSKQDYLGRKVRLYVTFSELDLREKYELPYMDAGYVISVWLPVILIFGAIIYFIVI